MRSKKHERGTHMRREREPEPGKHTALVDGVTYQWELRHGWGAAPGDLGYRGVSVSVWIRRERTRELIVDFPFSTFGRDLPQPQKLQAAVERAIPQAIAAGWVPDSRGRELRFTPEG